MALPERPSIAIIGGGLAGLTLSIGLTRYGIPHRIYESASAFSEIGAGVALGPNSITALELIDPRLEDVLKECITYNDGINAEGEGKGKDEWMDVRIGEEQGFNELITTIYHTSLKPARACVHRAKFLDELIKFIPSSIISFRKTLESITEDPSTGDPIVKFADGSNATASAVIACDGIKSVARQTYVLSDISNQEFLRPVFTNGFAYRGMFSRARFLDIVGDTIDAGKGKLFCGQDSYVVMYSVEKGTMMNVVAIKHISPTAAAGSDYGPLRHNTNWIQPVTSKTMLSDFETWGAPIKSLLSNIQRPERWALYDHLPAPTYVRNRVALMGDAAHAQTPHQGQGAGMAFEDSLILSGILGQVLNEFPTDINVPPSREPDTVNINTKLASCLRAYDQVRRPRTQELMRTSRETGEILGFAGEGIGRDLAQMKRNLDLRMKWIWDVDLPGEIDAGVKIAKECFEK